MLISILKRNLDKTGVLPNPIEKNLVLLKLSTISVRYNDNGCKFGKTTGACRAYIGNKSATCPSGLVKFAIDCKH